MDVPNEQRLSTLFRPRLLVGADRRCEVEAGIRPSDRLWANFEGGWPITCRAGAFPVRVIGRRRIPVAPVGLDRRAGM